jgi:hypothetical protein
MALSHKIRKEKGVFGRKRGGIEGMRQGVEAYVIIAIHEIKQAELYI